MEDFFQQFDNYVRDAKGTNHFFLEEMEKMLAPMKRGFESIGSALDDIASPELKDLLFKKEPLSLLDTSIKNIASKIGKMASGDDTSPLLSPKSNRLFNIVLTNIAKSLTERAKAIPKIVPVINNDQRPKQTTPETIRKDNSDGGIFKKLTQIEINTKNTRDRNQYDIKHMIPNRGEEDFIKRDGIHVASMDDSLLKKLNANSTSDQSGGSKSESSVGGLGLLGLLTPMVGLLAGGIGLLLGLFGETGKLIGLGSLKSLGGIGPMLKSIKLFKSASVALKVFKRIPIIGSLISFYYAYKAFSAGDTIGGVLQIASGIANFFPGIGTLISIGIDMFSALRNSATGGSEAASNMSVGEQSQAILNKLKELGGWVGEQIKIFGEWLWSKLKAGTASLFELGAPLMQMGLGGIGEWVGKLLVDGVSWYIETSIKGLKKIPGLVIKAIDWLQKINWASISKTLLTIPIKMLTKVFKGMFEFGKGVFKGITDRLEEKYNISSILKSNLEKLSIRFKKVAEGLIESLSFGAYGNIKKWLLGDDVEVPKLAKVNNVVEKTELATKVDNDVETPPKRNYAPRGQDQTTTTATTHQWEDKPIKIEANTDEGNALLKQQIDATKEQTTILTEAIAALIEITGASAGLVSQAALKGAGGAVSVVNNITSLDYSARNFRRDAAAKQARD